MNVTTPPTAKTVSTAAKDGADTARSAISDARKRARRQLIRARIAAARARAGTRSRASGTSTKAVGAAGAAGLAAGYFLDPESGKRRRQTARERALAVIRRGNGHRADEAEEPSSGPPDNAQVSG